MSPGQQHPASDVAERLGAWLKQSARTLPDPDDGIEHVLTRFPVTLQRRRWWRLAWPRRRDDASRSVVLDGPPSAQGRSPTMSGTLKLIGAGAIVALAAGYALSGAMVTQPPVDPAAPASHVVAPDGSGDFTTITEALAAAAEGDTILVRPGTYSEAIVIGKTITLMGDGEREAVVIEAPADGPQARGLPGDAYDHYALWLRGNDSTLSGFTLAGERSSIVIDGGAPTLEDLLLDGTGQAYHGGSSPNWNGITIRDGSRASVRDNLMRAGGPIGIFSGSEPTIEGNTLTGGPHIWGGWSGLGPGVVIRGNTIEGTFVRGIGLFNLADALVEANVITGAPGEGIAVPSGASIVRGNTITGGRNGIVVEAGPSSAATIESNAISDGDGIGIWVVRGAPIVTDNHVSGKSVGLLLMQADLPALAGNTFCGNEDNVKVIRNGREVQPEPELPGNEVCPDGLMTADAGG